MKKTRLFSLLGLFVIIVALAIGGCKKKNEEENYPQSYSPSFIAEGEKYISGGYAYLAFELKCTSDAVEITEVMVVGPHFTKTYSGGGETFNQNEPFYIYDEEKFIYDEGMYTFTIKGFIRSGSHSGDSFNEITRWELIIP